MRAKPATHKLLGDGRLLCRDDVQRASTIDKHVTCPRCLAMMKRAREAEAMQRIPVERWP